MKREVFNEVIAEAGDRFFSITFVKKDGSLRKLNGRLGVKRYLHGGRSTVNPDKYLTVFDVQKQEYRSINRDTVVEIHMRGKRYE